MRGAVIPQTCAHSTEIPGQRHPFPSREASGYWAPFSQASCRPSAAAGTREPPGPHTAGCAGRLQLPLLLSPKLCLSGPSGRHGTAHMLATTLL